MSSPPKSVAPRPGVLLAVFGLGVSAVMTQLVLMREMFSVFAGNEMVLGIILGNWLLLTGVGAWLGQAGGRLQKPECSLFLAQILIALLPPAQVGLLRVLRNVVFLPGAAVGVTGTVLSSFVLLSPYCLVSGAMLTLACAIRGRDGDPAAAGRVYCADSLGSIAGGALFSLVLVRSFDHIALLGFPAVLNLLLAALLSLWSTRREEALTPSRRKVSLLTPAATRFGWAAFGGVLALGTALLWLRADLDTASTARQYPGQSVLLRTNSPYGRLVVTEAAGQITFFENGLPVIATQSPESVEETAHYPMAQRPDAGHVLLVGGGISGTAQEVLKYGVRTVTCLEIDPAILAAGRRFLPAHLSDPRIRTVMTDGRHFIRQARERFDVVIVDASEPGTSQINRFYTAEFFGEVKEVLSTNGVLSFSLGRYENFVSPELARMLASAHRTLKRSFTNVLMIPGGRICFLASDGPLSTDIAGRIEQRGITTRFVKRHYLDAMLSSDRLADLHRAIAQPAAVNRDFSPVLYFYHLRHWMSQFTVRLGLLEGALAVLLAAYVARLRAVPLAVFASGFAASALEIVLLLSFQVLCGSLYLQMGLIVTTFMAGLAAGAAVMNRWLAGTWTGALPSFVRPSADPPRRAGRLYHLAFAIAGFAALLPPLLQLLHRVRSPLDSPVMVQVVMAVLTLLLAGLVGMEFPLANRLVSGAVAATASRLYAADFVGASLGALLPSTLLIPLLGVPAVCLITAGLNVLAALALLRAGAKA